MRIDHWNRVSMSIQFKINVYDQQEKDKPSRKIFHMMQYTRKAPLNLDILF
jgi:hypothetical protein